MLYIHLLGLSITSVVAIMGSLFGAIIAIVTYFLVVRYLSTHIKDSQPTSDDDVDMENDGH